MVPLERVEECFRSLGVPLENVFLIGEATSRVIAIWHPEIGAREFLIEKTDLAQACLQFLMNKGARTFASWEDFQTAARVEKWPGWDTCEPSTKLKR